MLAPRSAAWMRQCAQPRIQPVIPLQALGQVPKVQLREDSRLAGPNSFGSQKRLYHVAIVGSGPAGFYTAKYLFKEAKAGAPAQTPTDSHRMHIDMFERLPTPFGLVRFGVAPDHPEVKNVVNDFTEVAATADFRFFGNVEIGKDLSLEELRRMYDAVIMCAGAQGERLLGVPGEHLQGIVGAPAFVKWYNGHPDHVGLEPGQPGEAAAVIGHGNVALDIARILTRSPKELHQTDIDARALARIGKWQMQGLQTVHLLGRRGFIQSAFTNAELRELLTVSDEVLPIVDPEELALSRNPASEQELAKSRMKKRTVSILDKMASNFALRDSTSKRIIWLRFLLSPTEILPATDGAGVGGVRLGRTVLQGEPGRQSATVCKSSDSIDVKCGLVVRSVGFDLTPFNGVPLSPQRRVPHEHGRVEAMASEPSGSGGLYVSGWMKRGPQGIIASNIADAQETAHTVFQDLGQLPGARPGEGRAGLDATLQNVGLRVVSFSDWEKLNTEEQRRGSEEGRAAVKFTDTKDMMRFLGAPM